MRMITSLKKTKTTFIYMIWDSKLKRKNRRSSSFGRSFIRFARSWATSIEASIPLARSFTWNNTEHNLNTDFDRICTCLTRTTTLHPKLQINQPHLYLTAVTSTESMQVSTQIKCRSIQNLVFNRSSTGGIVNSPEIKLNDLKSLQVTFKLSLTLMKAFMS